MNTAETNMYDPHETIVSMSTKNFLWAVAGTILGIITNNVGIYISKMLGITDHNMLILIQLILCSIVLAVVHVKINNEFGWTWQNVTPGLFFVSFYFGTQFLSYSLIQSKYAL